MSKGMKFGKLDVRADLVYDVRDDIDALTKIGHRLVDEADRLKDDHEDTAVFLGTAIFSLGTSVGALERIKVMQIEDRLSKVVKSVAQRKKEKSDENN